MLDLQVLDRAREALAAKRYSGALELLVDELRKASPNAEALRIAGQSEYGMGRLDTAVQLLNRATRAAPDDASAHHALGNAQQDLGRLDRAIASYRRALRIAPALSAAENDLGTAYHAKGWHRQAAEAFERCIALDPGNYRALENLGSTLRAEGKLKPARRAFQRALWLKVTAPLRKLFGLSEPAGKPPQREPPRTAEIREAFEAGRFEEVDRLVEARLQRNPSDALALQLQAVSLNRRKSYAEALKILELLIPRSPDAYDLHDALGTSLRGLRYYNAALRSFNRALALNPKSAVVHSNISALMYDKFEYAQAAAAAEAALKIDPHSVPAMVNLGAALIALGRYADAEVALRRAVAVDPQMLKARLHLCEALRDQGKLDEMRAELDRVREIEPENADRHLHLGILAQEMEHDIPAALAHFRAAQKIIPENPAPYLNEALLRLANGEFGREVWDCYDRRKELSDRVAAFRAINLPEWDGSPLGAGELLVYGEQGLGDEIMFASLLREAIALAPRPRLAVQPPLQTLFARSFPDAEVISWLSQDGPPDRGGAKYATAIGSLGRLFRRSPQDFRQHGGYLRPDPERVAAMHSRLDALGTGRRIGISWRGGMPLTRGAKRTLLLSQLLPVLRRPGYHWINLQYGNVGEEIGALAKDAGIKIEQMHDATRDFEAAAALICALDLTISACSTTVHLAGALGRPVCVMAPYTAEWRYGMSGPRMLWYPSAEVFRQSRAGDWSNVVDQVGERLDAGFRGDA